MTYKLNRRDARALAFQPEFRNQQVHLHKAAVIDQMEKRGLLSKPKKGLINRFLSK